MTTLETAPTGTTAATPAADPDEVAGRVVGILNDGAICLLTSIGHELGLFETLASLPPATSAQVADAAGLDERYVREWLGGMVTAGFVQYVPDDRTYYLCPDHAPFLTGTGADNLARTMRFVSLMGLVQPKVVDAFRNGGGLSYDDYPGFHHLQAADSAAVNDASLLDTIIPLAGVTDRLGQASAWPTSVAGRATRSTCSRAPTPAARFVGYDFSEEAVAAARARGRRRGDSANARFEVLDVAQPVAEVGCLRPGHHLRRRPRPGPPGAAVLANVRRALRPDGTYLMVDINASSNLEDNLDLPWASFLYAASTVHCMSVSLGQGGDGLGTVWGVQTAERMLREAGFSEVVVHELEEDPFNAYFVARP